MNNFFGWLFKYLSFNFSGSFRLAKLNLAGKNQVVFIFINMFLGALGAIALFVATLQIANTMTMSVLERTREIGVMKAIGARDRDVRRMFLAEAGIIGLSGALLGVLIAWGASRIVEFALRAYFESQGVTALADQRLFAIPTWLFVGVLSFGVGVSLLAALIPAWRGARTAPAVALRRE